MSDKSIYERPITQHGGSKYLRTIYPADGIGEPIKVDVYAVLKAFNVTCPALQHAAKKLLCTGVRGKGSKIDDIHGIFEAMWRALELAKQEEQNDKLGEPALSPTEEKVRQTTDRVIKGLERAVEEEVRLRQQEDSSPPLRASVSDLPLATMPVPVAQQAVPKEAFVLGMGNIPILLKGDPKAIHLKRVGPGAMSLCGLMGVAERTDDRAKVSCKSCLDVIRENKS